MLFYLFQVTITYTIHTFTTNIHILYTKTGKMEVACGDGFITTLGSSTIGFYFLMKILLSGGLLSI